MAKQESLTLLILTILLGLPICALAEGPVSGPAAAQDETEETTVFSIPSVGYVFEPEALALRPILGTPGAAVFGSRVELGMNVRRAWVSPRQNFALAEVASSAEVVLLTLQPAAQALKTLSTLATGADQVAVSPTGSAMAFYYGTDQHLQIVSGLPDSAEVSLGINISDLPGRLSTLAVSDDGRVSLVASTDGESGAVYLVQSEEKRVLVQCRDVRAMTFLTNSSNAVIADTAANEVRLINDVTGAATTQILAEESRGISYPLALQVSADNSRVFCLNSGAGTVTTVELTSGLLTHLAINSSASKLQRLSGDVFQLTDDLRQSTLLFDAAGPEPRIVFVPSVNSPESGRASRSRDPISDKRRSLPLESGN